MFRYHKPREEKRGSSGNQSTNQKIRSRTVEKLFGSHHMIIFLNVKPINNFFRRKGSSLPINKSETRSIVNIWIPLCGCFSSLLKNSSEGRNFEGAQQAEGFHCYMSYCQKHTYLCLF